MLPQTSAFDTGFFPQQVILLTVGENMMPMGYWTVISKEPFRFLLCMQVGNYSLTLLKKYKEAAIHFMPWEMRENVVKAGYISGRNQNKAQLLGFQLQDAEKLSHTKLVTGAELIYECTLSRELPPNYSREFVLLIVDVLAQHGKITPANRKPIFYMSMEDFATFGEQWHYQKSDF